MRHFYKTAFFMMAVLAITANAKESQYQISAIEQPKNLVLQNPCEGSQGGVGQLPAELKKMVNMINKERVSRGHKRLKVDPKLNCAAQRHSNDVGPKKLCQHKGTDGSSPWKRAEDCGTRAFGENVACGQRTPRAAVDAWIKSPGHFKNMMSDKFEYIGVGVKNFFWTNIFR